MAARTCSLMRCFPIRRSAVSVIRYPVPVRFGLEASWALRQRRSARPDWRRWPATLSVGRLRILISRRPPTAPQSRAASAAMCQPAETLAQQLNAFLRWGTTTRQPCCLHEAQPTNLDSFYIQEFARKRSKIPSHLS